MNKALVLGIGLLVIYLAVSGKGEQLLKTLFSTGTVGTNV